MIEFSLFIKELPTRRSSRAQFDQCGVIMNVSWRGTVAAVAGAGLMAFAAVALTQEPIAPRATAQTGSRVVAAAQADVIHVNSCHVILIDKVTVAAARGGVLAVVKPEEGYEVKLDELIAKIKDEVAAAQFATAEKTFQNDIEIRFGQKSAELALVEYQRAMTANLAVPGTFPDIEIKRLKLAWERAVLQTENAEKEHDIAGSKRDEAGELLQTHVVEAPLAGLVTKVYKRTGEAVREGDPIVDVVNSNRMRVSGYVPFKDISRMRPGDKVLVKLDVPDVEVPEEDQHFEGRITFISVAVQKVRPEVQVFAEVINRDGILRDGAVAKMVVYPGKMFAPPNATTKREFPRRPKGEE